MHISNQIETIYKTSELLMSSVCSDTYQEEVDEIYGHLLKIEHINDYNYNTQHALETCLRELMYITEIIADLK